MMRGIGSGLGGAWFVIDAWRICRRGRIRAKYESKERWFLDWPLGPPMGFGVCWRPSSNVLWYFAEEYF